MATSPQDGLRVLIAGGGTGGHVIPAIAIGRELRDRYGADVRMVGTARGIETRLVPAAGFPLELIRVGQLKNVSLLTRIRTLADLPLGIANCIGLIRSFQPHVVVGVGGYASGPAMLAAILLRVPTLAYEPNAAPGLANRIAGRYVTAAAVAFDEARQYFRNAEVTGVPVREAICAAGPLRVSPPRLLVTAGSNGAQVFNEMLPVIALDLFAAVPGLTIVHQTGERAFQVVADTYRDAGLGSDLVTVSPFLNDIPLELSAATLVLARSGSTVAELAAAGRPSLLVPFPQAADDHQTKNALAMVRADAAEMLPQAGLTTATLRDRLEELLNDADRLLAMSVAARACSRPDALRHIADKVVALRRR